MHTHKEGLNRIWKVPLRDPYYLEFFEWNDFDSMYKNCGKTREGRLDYRGIYTNMAYATHKVTKEIYVPHKVGEIHMVKDSFDEILLSRKMWHAVDEIYRNTRKDRSKKRRKRYNIDDDELERNIRMCWEKSRDTVKKNEMSTLREHRTDTRYVQVGSVG